MKPDAIRSAVFFLLRALAILTGFAMLALFMDNILDGLFRQWIAKFVVGLDAYYLDWSLVWQRGFWGCTLLSLALSGIWSLAANRARRAERKRLRSEIIRFIDELNRSDALDAHLPPPEAEIEARFVRMKSDALRAQQLAETEMQRKSDLITYLAHDLKTPLASVIAYLSLLSEAPALPEEQRVQYIRVALEKAYRLEQLIAELFEIIRFNLQTISLNRSNIRLSFMLEQLADEFYPILLARRQTIRVEAPEDLILFADADKLARVFNNILKNAAAYGEEGSEIRLTAKAEDGEAVISFEDTGDEIPEAQQKLIFEKFYRLDRARSGRTGGAGLGLAIAKEIVTAHGGGIGVESHSRRTVFTVRLPIENQA